MNFNVGQLSGNMEPTPVLEISMSKLLKISANGTKLVSWDTKLGYQKQPIVSRSLSSLCCDGGLIPFVDVIIMRKYPLAFNEVLSDGSIITRTAREEDLAEREHEVSGFALIAVFFISDDLLNALAVTY